MLYMTTVDNQCDYTESQVLTADFATDGGLYIPSSLPLIDTQQLNEFISSGCCSTIGKILNAFFAAGLSEWDVQVCIGRSPIRAAAFGHKLLIADAWQNPGNSYEYALCCLNDRLAGAVNTPVSGWVRIAVEIAFLFGIYAELRRCEMLEPRHTYDVCVPEGDLSHLIAALYARKMGLPIGNIIVCSNNNSALWDFVNHGQLNISCIPQNNRVPMQRLINVLLDCECVKQYVKACDRGGLYSVEPEQHVILSESFFAAVASDERIRTIIDNVGIPVTQETAMCYAGVQDYRAQTGQGNLTVMLGYRPPNQNI